MDHMRILRRAFDITRVYRALWLFGVLLALTTARGSNNFQYAFDRNDNPFRGDIPWPPTFDWPFQALPSGVVNAALAAFAAVACVVLVLGVIFAILRYISQTALIRMVSSYEAAGERVSIRDGFRLGWSRESFRSFLINLVFALAGIVVVLVSLALVAAPLLLWTTGDNTAGTVGTVMAIGLFFLWLLAIILAAAVVSIVLELAFRAVVLEGYGVFDGIRRGWGLFRRRLGDNILMGLILFGINLAVSVLMIPVIILLVLVGVLVGGIPALLAGGLTNIFTDGGAPRAVALAVGLPILLLVIAIPLTIIAGIFETFKSAVWTLAFRELIALESVQRATPPAPIAPSTTPEMMPE